VTAEPGANGEIVRRAWEAWGQGNVDEWLEFFDPDVDYRPIDRGIDPTPRLGRDELRRFTEAFRDDWAEWTQDVREVIEAGDKVLVRTRVQGRALRSGIELSGRLFHVHTLRDGKIVRLEDFMEPEPARLAAGLD
jgi:ketosteroid isomerase-like protein